MAQPDLVARLRAAGCVFAEDEAALLLAAVGRGDALDDLVRRRIDGEPLEHLLGFVDFCGLRLSLGPGVFVPRTRTGLLVREAARALPAAPAPVVVDLCCGCGAVAAALRAASPGIDVHAADVDPTAVRWARENLPHERVHLGDLYAALPVRLRGRVDVLTANAPYVPSRGIALMPPEARDHEPPVALDGGDDGLAVLRRVIDGAPEWLAPNGTLLVESGTDQAPVLAAAMTAAGLLPRVVDEEETGGTVVLGVSRRRS